LLGLAIGVLVGYFALATELQPWGALGGGLLGLLASGLLYRLIQSNQGLGQRRINETDFGWKTSASLARAISQAGVSGLVFELKQVVVEQGTLSLVFYPFGAVPLGKEHAAGLALRCIVGLTLPSLAASISDVKVLRQSADYSVNLGRGVPVRAIVLQAGVDRAGPLQVISSEEEGKWYVSVTHFVETEDYGQQIRMQQRIFQKLVSAFEVLKQQPILLAD
jgi:hypothetical protein